MTQELTEQIEQVVAPLLGESQLDLINIKIKRQGRRCLITIFADKPEGGITIDECAVINKRIVEKVDEENLVGDDYVLEVASPGVDRPLVTKKDFLRVVHKKVRFLLFEALDNKKEYTGIINRVNEGQVSIMCSPPEELTIPLGKIERAVQII